MTQTSREQAELTAIRDELNDVAGLLAECADRVRALSALPAAEIEPALNALLLDLAGAIEEAGAKQTRGRLNGKCSWCGEPMEIPDRPQGGGRTKLYCSEAHKQAAHRAARK